MLVKNDHKETFKLHIYMFNFNTAVINPIVIFIVAVSSNQTYILGAIIL